MVGEGHARGAAQCLLCQTLTSSPGPQICRSISRKTERVHACHVEVTPLMGTVPTVTTIQSVCIQELSGEETRWGGRKEEETAAGAGKRKSSELRESCLLALAGLRFLCCQWPGLQSGGDW